MNKKKVAVIIGIILIVIGVITLIYAQGQINASHGYTWTQPYSDFESKIVNIKNIGIGSLIIGIVDVLVITFSNVLKKDS